ncbi:hypothetical protein APR09_002555 [Nocardia amikacinitolerans]|nr:hypothetical protein [Nocardia amikacinitolerans]
MGGDRWIAGPRGTQRVAVDIVVAFPSRPLGGSRQEDAASAAAHRDTRGGPVGRRSAGMATQRMCIAAPRLSGALGGSDADSRRHVEIHAGGADRGRCSGGDPARRGSAPDWAPTWPAAIRRSNKHIAAAARRTGTFAADRRAVIDRSPGLMTTTADVRGHHGAPWERAFGGSAADSRRHVEIHGGRRRPGALFRWRFGAPRVPHRTGRRPGQLGRRIVPVGGEAAGDCARRGDVSTREFGRRAQFRNQRATTEFR